MKSNSLENECQSLRSIRERWRSVSWPLGRIDGENSIIECLYTLRNFTIYEALSTKSESGHTVEQLIEDLEDFYRTALQEWDEFRTVFECKYSQRHFSRWPDGTYPARIRRSARLDFWEMVTTSRFNVRDLKNPGKQIAEHFGPLSPLEIRHSVSLAIMVCIHDAIEALEQIEDAGNSESDHANLDEAWAAREHAALWFDHLDTLNAASSEKNRAVKRAQAEIEKKHKSNESERNRENAKKLRTPLTPKLVADYALAHPGQRPKELVLNLVDMYGAKERTVRTRLKEARENKLMQ